LIGLSVRLIGWIIGYLINPMIGLIGLADRMIGLIFF
jgi:hypothetical protein